MSEFRFRAAGVLGLGLVRALHATCRKRVTGAEHLQRLRGEGHGCVLVIWHGTMLVPIHHHQGDPITTLVSEHGDGEYITRILQRMGFETVRGSSTRGGSRGLRGLVKAGRNGRIMAITPDGPQGPRRVMKPGALLAAQLAGVPVVPIGVGVSRGWQARSWDRFTVPKPFATLGLAYGPPIEVDRSLDEAGLQRCSDEVQRALDTVTAEAERLAGAPVEDAGSTGRDGDRRDPAASARTDEPPRDPPKATS